MKSMFDPSYVMKISLALIIAAVMLGAGCATIPEKNPALDRARAAYERAASDPNVEKNAPVALYEAGQTLKKAEQAKDAEEMEYLAYIAERKAQIAMAQTEEKIAEKEMDELSREKEKIVLQARELEAKQAMSLAEQRAQEAEQARSEAEEKARETEKAKGEAQALAQQAEMARTEAEARAVQVEKAKSEAEAGKLEAEAARLKAEEALAQKRQLESELAELKAKQTEKGTVLTLGDILFETGKANLMPGAMHSIDILADFLKKYPKRNVLIEGFTDSTGSDTYNLGLSQRRADSVRDALTARGIAAERITAKGYGKRFPVASNSTSAGRQQNRRVEITILEEGVGPEKMSR
jgi:outer membrane protein OmpA-like peptidoglycan-associated protein